MVMDGWVVMTKWGVRVIGRGVDMVPLVVTSSMGRDGWVVVVTFVGVTLVVTYTLISSVR